MNRLSDFRRHFRRALSLLLSLVLAFALTLPGGAARAEDVQAPAGEDLTEAFLQALAEGLVRRQSIYPASDDDYTAAYYKSLPAAELELLREFTDVRFPDERFDRLAHLYISACETQYAAADFVDEPDAWLLYDQLWNGGLQLRCCIVVELSERYGLALPAELLDSFLAYRNSHLLTACENCGRGVPWDGTYCPYCGEEMTFIYYSDDVTAFYSEPGLFAARFEQELAECWEDTVGQALTDLKTEKGQAENDYLYQIPILSDATIRLSLSTDEQGLVNTAAIFLDNAGQEDSDQSLYLLAATALISCTGNSAMTVDDARGILSAVMQASLNGDSSYTDGGFRYGLTLSGNIYFFVVYG